jgi:hypothetical protein
MTKTEMAMLKAIEEIAHSLRNCHSLFLEGRVQNPSKLLKGDPRIAKEWQRACAGVLADHPSLSFLSRPK